MKVGLRKTKVVLSNCASPLEPGSVKAGKLSCLRALCMPLPLRQVANRTAGRKRRAGQGSEQTFRVDRDNWSEGLFVAGRVLEPVRAGAGSSRGSARRGTLVWHHDGHLRFFYFLVKCEAHQGSRSHQVTLNPFSCSKEGKCEIQVLPLSLVLACSCARVYAHASVSFGHHAWLLHECRPHSLRRFNF